MSAASATTGAAYLGTRPTFDDGMPVLEVFLFDFDGDLYGRDIEVEFVDFIRGDRKFDSGARRWSRRCEADCCAARRAVLPSRRLSRRPVQKPSALPPRPLRLAAARARVA